MIVRESIYAIQPIVPKMYMSTNLHYKNLDITAIVG